ncbi:MAG: hypothetical protein COB85_05895 [Bacteroidetes bacterium]|nr:MAG: hypothetical protein COB85_05895 [Bacteroidota bacterium]
MESIYEKIATLEISDQKGALCTIVRCSGSTPRKMGTKMLVYADGSIFGSIGGGALEKKVIEDALSVIKSDIANSYDHTLVQDLGMCCGGALMIFIEPVMNRKSLYIFGAGHIGKALAHIAGDVDFAVTLIDERSSELSQYGNNGVSVIYKKHTRAFKELEFNQNTFIAVITHDHAYDRDIVSYCANQPHAYLGMIGSIRKVEIAKKAFKAGKKLSAKQMKNIDWPMGINIEVNTPEEIAISILAKMIDVRSKARA